MQSGIERRKTARISSRGSVDCRPYGLLLPTLEMDVIHGNVVDVSADGYGIGFVTSHPVFTGRKMRLEGDTGPRAAEVRWVGAAPQGYRVGVSIRDDAASASLN
jgi:hypothetical protein